HALSIARSIPGFPATRAAAAGATASLGDPGAAAVGAPSNGALPTSDASPLGPPRAEIPTALGSSAAIVDGFELHGGPDRPFAQRLGFESGPAMNFPLPSQTVSAVPAIAPFSTDAAAE